MRSALALAACVAIVAFPSMVSMRPAGAAVAPDCTAPDLKLNVSEDSPGAGHFGVLVTLTNTSAIACALPQAPTFEFQNEAGLDIATGAPPKANIILSAGKSGYAHAMWSDGTGNNGPCLDATKFSVHLDLTTNPLTAMLAAHMCTTDVAAPLFTAYAFSLSRDPVVPAGTPAP